MGELNFHMGVMKSGKSLGLLNTAEQLERGNHPILVMKPATDNRDGELITSRFGQLSRMPDIVFGEDERLDDMIRRQRVADAIPHYVRILIDEAQFATEEQVDQLLELAVEDDEKIDAYGLRVDFLNHLFEGSKRLIEVAHNVHEYLAVCRCGDDARTNARLIDGQFVFEGDSVAIEIGETTYEPLCIDCYLSEKRLAQITTNS